MSLDPEGSGCKIPCVQIQSVVDRKLLPHLLERLDRIEARASSDSASSKPSRLHHPPRVGPPLGRLPRGGAHLGRFAPVRSSQKRAWGCERGKVGRCEFGRVLSKELSDSQRGSASASMSSQAEQQSATLTSIMVSSAEEA